MGKKLLNQLYERTFSCLLLTSSGTALIFSVYLLTTSSGFFPCHRIYDERDEMTIKEKPKLPQIPQVYGKKRQYGWTAGGICLSFKHKRITRSWRLTNFHQFQRPLSAASRLSDKREWEGIWVEYACLWWERGGHLQTGTKQPAILIFSDNPCVQPGWHGWEHTHSLHP